MANSLIKVLDTRVVDQIAAGEVVERPASVVKELIENAIDAGAKNIKVLIKNGGLDFISITDDGRGMSREDIGLSVERFATSKLTTADDLESLYTYGFRGEALPSIASVSRFSIKTKSRNEDKGYLLEFDDKGCKLINQISCDYGTIIEVKDLFYNVPARKKFLKSPKSESNSIKTVVADFSIAKPEVCFLLQEDSDELLSFGSFDLLPERVKKIGLISGNYVPVYNERSYQSNAESGAGRTSNIKVSGLISEPIHCPKVGTKMKFLVNERIIKSSFLMRAVRDGYESLLKYGYYPSGVISVEISPFDLDVNVHPQKTEVRFASEGMVFATVKRAVQESLEKFSSLKNVFSTNDISQNASSNNKVYLMTHPSRDVSQSEIQFVGNGGMILSEPTFEASNYKTSPDFISNPGSKTQSIFRSQSESVSSESRLLSQDNNQVLYKYKFLGQAFKLYLFFSSNEKVAVVDMHAAHERVTFFKLKKQFVEKRLFIQELLIPLSFPISVLDNTVSIDERLESIKILGIEAELRDSEIVVRGMSPLLDSSRAEEIIVELLNKGEGELIEAEISKKVDSYLARIACHGSLRRGRELKPEEAYELLEQVQIAENSGWCPHGRPIVWWITENDLEKQFGRVQ